MYKSVFFVFLTCFGYVKGSAQSVHGPTVHLRIAQKLQDTLGLSAAQKDSIYSINHQLQNKKMLARQQYTGTDSLGYHLQRIENTRDSLYKPVLGAEKYLLYKQKKRNLISAN